MAPQTILAGILMDETTTIAVSQVCEKYGISEALLQEMVEHGLFDEQTMHSKSIHINEQTLSRIQSACRLQEDLELNLPGVVLVLELLEELERMRDELIILRRHVRS